jgi:hypothetical protein
MSGMPASRCCLSHGSAVTARPAACGASGTRRSISSLRGTGSSNPVSSSGASTNFRFLFAPHAHLSAALVLQPGYRCIKSQAWMPDFDTCEPSA